MSANWFFYVIQNNGSAYFGIDKSTSQKIIESLLFTMGAKHDKYHICLWQRAAFDWNKALRFFLRKQSNYDNLS